MRDAEKKQLYAVWSAMHRRCENESAPDYRYYGGRGITVCERWKNVATFIRDMGPRPHKTELERIDGDKGYSPENCRWATRTEQNSNRSNCIYVTHAGKRMTLKEACCRLNLSYDTVRIRITQLGWTPERALTTKITSPKKQIVNGVSLKQACIARGIDYSTVLKRLRRGWDTEKAITKPIRGRKS